MIVDIMQLKKQGLSKRAAAQRLGISRDTVRKYWDGLPSKAGDYGPRPKLADPYRDYIIKRLEKYPELSAERLFDESRPRVTRVLPVLCDVMWLLCDPANTANLNPLKLYPESRRRRIGVISELSQWRGQPINFMPLFSHSVGAELAM